MQPKLVSFSPLPTVGLVLPLYCANLGSLSLELLTMHRLAHSRDFDSMRIEAILIPSLLRLASRAWHIGDNTDQINGNKK